MCVSERVREKEREKEEAKGKETEREGEGDTWGKSIDGAFTRVNKDVRLSQRCTHCFLECARQDRLGNFWEASNANKVIEALENAVPGFSIKVEYQDYH